VVSKPSGTSTTEGTAGVKPPGVEPAQPTTSQPNGGENAQPPALEQTPTPTSAPQPAPQPASEPVKSVAKPVAKTADELHAQREDIRDQQYRLLGPDGKIPKEGTPEKAQFDKYEAEHVQLTKDWAYAHRTERRQAVEAANREARKNKPVVKEVAPVENAPNTMGAMAEQLPTSKGKIKETTAPKIKLDNEEIPRHTEGDKKGQPLNAFEAEKLKYLLTQKLKYKLLKKVRKLVAQKKKNKINPMLLQKLIPIKILKAKGQDLTRQLNNLLLGT
jgi:hypothetical protein